MDQEQRKSPPPANAPNIAVLDYAPGMPVTIICPQCEIRLGQASDAMRHHAALMHTAIELVKSREPTEEEQQNFGTRLVASFWDAQSAWDAYRDHMKEHGYLSSPHE